MQKDAYPVHCLIMEIKTIQQRFGWSVNPYLQRILWPSDRQRKDQTRILQIRCFYGWNGCSSDEFGDWKKQI